MAIPSLKKISINSADPEILTAQLDNIDFRSRPHILSLHAVSESQQVCLDFINEYFRKYPYKLLPYPPYVLTNIKDNQSIVRLISSEEQLPKLYKIKERPLNHKETNLLNRIELLQKNFSHINLYESQATLDSYSSHQRDLKKIQLEINFLDKLSQSLEDENELS